MDVKQKVENLILRESLYKSAGSKKFSYKLCANSEVSLFQTNIYRKYSSLNHWSKSSLIISHYEN